ncbi:hypothetical protein P168DRAFT_320341 [Aspergillus campestris IBT 28561]|uniref:Wax synthase domain-containing protein n=1 Tax=Aspergillus campestris (strain IBT 28561) TaxID=1392248 RepID=A0A2I1CYW7_ASPC2|nr:uncharacterized protein P168DRAFT_320341 [Aspergillus campestris IBT 28561]PKY02800.1 hypothetical protein P168DRAFT_320341 [Aspergillus campestris IBT 28561]
MSTSWFLPFAFMLPTLHAAILLSTTKHKPPRRLTYLPTLAGAIYWRIYHLPQTTIHPFAKCATAVLLLVNGLHSINLLFLLDTIPEYTPFLPAVNLVLNLRGIGTPWQARHLPHWPAAFAHRPPSRPAFLARQCAIFAWQYLAVDLILTQSGRGVDPTAPHNLKWLFLDPSSTRWFPRLLSALWTPLILLRLVIDGPYRFFSIVFVAARLVPPAQFPPLYGSIWDAWCLRNVWGKYWHQLFQLPLRIPITTLITNSRPIAITLIFLLSGLIHHFASPAIDTPATSSSTAVPYFLGFAIAVILEVVFSRLFSRLSLPPSITSIIPQKQAFHAIGFLWVGAWLAALSPLYIADVASFFATHRMGLPGDVLLS